MPPNNKIGGFQIYSVKVVIFILPILLYSIFRAGKADRVQLDAYRKSMVYVPKKVNWKVGENPDPPRLSSESEYKQIYVAVLDDEYKPQPHQCLLQKLWINDFLQKEEVDGVEFYSVNKWTNSECNITTITPDVLPEQTINPGAFLLIRSMEMALNRTNAKWLMFIKDSAYVDVDRFFPYFISRVVEGYNQIMIGSCVEERYFFQMLLLDSGVIIDRNFAQKIVDNKNDLILNISQQIGVTDDEALAKISDKLGVYIAHKQTTEFVGRGFRHRHEYETLKLKNFTNLPYCSIPPEYIHPPPGHLALCSDKVYKLNSMIIWSGARFMSKQEFLESVPQLLGDNPDFVSYYWDRRFLTLCQPE